MEIPFEYWMGDWVLACVCNYSFFCGCTCDCGSQCIMLVPMQMKTEGACALCVCECVCVSVHVSLWVPVCMFVFTKASHIPQFAASPQHTQTGVRTGESESPDCGAWPRWANITLALPISVSLSLSFAVCLSWFSLYSLFPTVPNTESLFVIQSRKCNWSQICPAFRLISSLLCSNRLPSPCAWPQTASAEAHGNKRSSDEMDLVRSCMSDFKCSLRWHLGNDEIKVEYMSSIECEREGVGLNVAAVFLFYFIPFFFFTGDNALSKNTMWY